MSDIEDRICALEHSSSQRLILAGDKRDQNGWGALNNWFEGRLAEQSAIERDIVAHALAMMRDEIVDLCKAAIEERLTQRIRGTFNPRESYSALDIVACGGASFISRRDSPGPCPGSGWQLFAKQGQRGIAGPEGRRGPPGAIVTGWIVDRSAYRVTPRMSDGTLGPPLELRALFIDGEGDGT